MWIVTLNSLSVEDIKNGIAQTVRKRIKWPPNLTKFIELCEGVEDSSESFYRFINREPPKDAAEYITRNRVGFQCRTQLPADEALKLWSKTIAHVRSSIASGELSDIDFNTKRIDTPEKMKKTLTPEQRNQQLDRQIDEMIEKGQRLIGPFKQRYEERKNGN